MKLSTKKLNSHSSPQLKSLLTKTDKLRSDFPIVGIGASAGGLDALELFFKNIPEDNGMAFVVIQHLDPTRKGMLPELLQRFTSMVVVPVRDRLLVKPNCVYVIPSNKSMSILNRTLYLFEPVQTRGLRLPIDFFFSSLADDLKENSIGIILSGMGSDGSIGLRAIKEKSGLVLVQDPESAKFDGMPRSAINTVPVDYIVPANEIPDKLISYLKNKSVLNFSAALPAKDKSSLEKIVILLRTHTGHDFSLYKNTTLYRRIERRMGILKVNTIVDYVIYLQENSKEIDVLFQELLIGVTNFFRDAQVWDLLKDKILPQMFAELTNDCNFRAWVPGCSTGEEAYSLAIIFKEVLEKLKEPKKINFQIFATDLDIDAIEKARKSIYPELINGNVSSDRLNRFFNKTKEGGYRINTEIREMVIFAPQNIIKDPPLTKLDFLSCRNMLIYMESELQMKLMKLFQFCLNPGGLLLLGNSETLGSQSSLFSAVNAKLRIYKRAEHLKVVGQVDFPPAYSGKIVVRDERKTPPKVNDNIQTLADQLLLQNYAPASVMTNEKGDIIYITGHTGNYLEPSAGKANMNVFAMAREGLRNELNIAFRKVMHSNEQVELQNIMVGAKGNKLLVNVSIQKIEKPEALLGMYLFVFSDFPVLQEIKPKKLSKKEIVAYPNLLVLEAELQRTKADLELTIEEMQTSQEELKSTNEELQSTNEELQSTNEELTTSKEEMQSLNEELQTVNIELQRKVDDYIRINNDLKNLLDSTNIATLFLDRNLNIRQFTAQATNVFKLILSDIGRPFTDIAHNLNYPGISQDAHDVLLTLTAIEKDITTDDNRWFSVRLIPYRTIDDRVDGLVITFTDISLTKKLEFELRKTNDVLQLTNEELETTNEELRKSEFKYRLLFENLTTDFIVYEMVYDEKGNPIDIRYLDVNPAFEKTANLPASAIIGKTAKELFPGTEQHWIDLYAKVVQTEEPVSYENYSIPFKKYLEIKAFHTEKNHFAVIFSDITERREAKLRDQKLLDDKVLLLKDIHHRVKNNMNTICALLQIQSDKQVNSSTKDALLDAGNRVRSMMLLYDRLYRSENFDSIALKDYIPSFISEIIGIFPNNQNVKVKTVLDDVTLGIEVLNPFGLIVNELITNIMKYAFKDQDNCLITVTAVKNENHVIFSIEDNGCGIPEDVSIENSTGLGLMLVGMLVEQISGTIKIERHNGTKFIIEF
jgi:two-component system CheB/CheR fusion protein